MSTCPILPLEIIFSLSPPQLGRGGGKIYWETLISFVADTAEHSGLCVIKALFCSVVIQNVPFPFMKGRQEKSALQITFCFHTNFDGFACVLNSNYKFKLHTSKNNYMRFKMFVSLLRYRYENILMCHCYIYDGQLCICLCQFLCQWRTGQLFFIVHGQLGV